MIFIEKTTNPPECLEREKSKTNGKYNCIEVRELLNKDFFGKCYICGIEPIQDGGEIEHLVAHKENLDKKFDWDNLFLSCGHCNSVKNKNKFSENVINCTKVDPSKHIRQEYKDKLVVVTPLDDNLQSVTTANLIDECFNGDTTYKRKLASGVRRGELAEEMDLFFRSLNKYKENQSVKNKQTIKSLLKSERKFTALKRDYLRVHNSELLE